MELQGQEYWLWFIYMLFGPTTGPLGLRLLSESEEELFVIPLNIGLSSFPLVGFIGVWRGNDTIGLLRAETFEKLRIAEPI